MPSAPLDVVMNAINAANTRLNGRVETLQAIGGQIIYNTWAFSQQVTNDAWRKLQNRLADLRYGALQSEVVFTAVGATGSTDPLTQASINFVQYFDGQNVQAAPVLPQNLIRPYFLTERPNGSGQLFTEMDEILGLAACGEGQLESTMVVAQQHAVPTRRARGHRYQYGLRPIARRFRGRSVAMVSAEHSDPKLY